MEFSYTESTDTGTNMVTKDYSKSRMRENRTYGSVRGGQSNLIPSTRLMGPAGPRVVVSPGGDEYKCCLRQRAPLVGAGQWRQCEFMAAAERKPNNRASPGGKQANRPVGRLKCTPSAAYRRCLPRRGRFALHSASGLISISRHSAAKTSPSGVAKELDS